MTIENDNFDPKLFLPNNIIIKSAGTHLYRIGLSLYPNGLESRSLLHNPWIMSITFTSLIIKFMLPLLFPDQDQRFFITIGDFSYFFNGSIHLNIAAVLITSLAFATHLIHYKNYKNHIKPTYLKPFEMIAGLVPPIRVGLTNKDTIYKFVKSARVLFICCKYFTTLVMPSAAFCLPFLTFAIYLSFEDFLYYGLIHTFLFFLVCYYNYCTITWQLIYFHLICYHIKSKIKSINTEIKSNIERRFRPRNRDVMKYIRPLNSIYREVDEYNENYWSKFLLLIWVSFATIINTVLYLTLFVSMNFGLRFILIYSSIFFICILILIINTASSVAYEANKSYELFNTYFALDSKKQLSLAKRMKVNILFKFTKNIHSF